MLHHLASRLDPVDRRTTPGPSSRTRTPRGRAFSPARPRARFVSLARSVKAGSAAGPAGGKPPGQRDVPGCERSYHAPVEHRACIVGLHQDRRWGLLRRDQPIGWRRTSGADPGAMGARRDHRRPRPRPVEMPPAASTGDGRLGLASSSTSCGEAAGCRRRRWAPAGSVPWATEARPRPPQRACRRLTAESWTWTQGGERSRGHGNALDPTVSGFAEGERHPRCGLRASRHGVEQLRPSLRAGPAHQPLAEPAPAALGDRAPRGR